MFLGVRYMPDLAILLIALGLQVFVATRLIGSDERKRRMVRIALIVSSLFLIAGVILISGTLLNLIPSVTGEWVRGGALAWGMGLIGAAVAGLLVQPARKFSPSRRGALNMACRAAIAAPLAGVGFGLIVQRNDFRISEISVPIPGLPKDLDGLRIVQVTDIHLGSFLAEEQLAGVIDMANETKAHLAVVTGDLISMAGDPIDSAIAQIARLKADAGVFGCHGNHEIYAGVIGYTTRETAKRGIRILRMESERLRFGGSTLTLAGVDYQKMRNPYLIGAEKLVQPGDINILLSHNPDVFPVAAKKGFDLTLAGHTHGGQINVEILHQNLNVTRFVTPYTNGLYREGQSAIYVSRGIGTVGIPVRFGAPPEVALIRLCAT